MLQRKQVRLPAGFQLLPAIDLRGGQVVRLSEGDFARETVYGTDPAEVARSFAAAGARWIHVVDLDGARDGGRRQTEAVARIVAAVGDGVSPARWRAVCATRRPWRRLLPLGRRGRWLVRRPCATRIWLNG